MPATEEVDRQVKPFATVIQEIKGGQLAALLSDETQKLVGAVVEHAKKGVLTLQITVEPYKPGNVDNLTVSAKVTVKAPSQEPSAVFFVDRDNNLVRDDPRQIAMPIRVASSNGRTATA